MKIGVITFSNSKDNYGQLLQCYALQVYLKKQGHDAFLIRYQRTVSDIKQKSKIEKFFNYLKNPFAYIDYYVRTKRLNQNKKLYYDASGERKRQFDSFIKDQLSCTKMYVDDEIMQYPPVADAYICGSDQIWGGDWVYYLSFAPKDSLKIAYAPSLGGLSSFSSEYEEKMKVYLSRFDFIGMREQSGVDMCHRLGFDKAVKVVDPTLLLSSMDYNAIRIETNQNKPYIFLYLLGNPMDGEVDEIYEYAHKKNYDVVYVASQGRYDKHSKQYVQIGEWVDYLAKADIVITNSFHCTVFSLLFERPFISIPLIGGYKRMNGRIEELLRECGLSNQVYAECFDNISIKGIDFSKFREYREKEEKKSYDYLSLLLLSDFAKS